MCVQMPLNYQHQIDLIKDILSDHQTEACGTVAECEQLERLAKSLIANTNIQQNVKQILADIYNYSQTGKNTQYLTDHIHAHQEQLTNWINTIDQ
jgi:predicted Zn-dependent peptidase